ncbi:hypothetical protein HZB90_02875 [archaeon]|nr:hypothetical protein [archaeon]
MRYTYFDAETDRIVAEGKETVILKNDAGKLEKLFIVPISGGKSFVFKKKEVDMGARVWNPKKKKEETLF